MTTENEFSVHRATVKECSRAKDYIQQSDRWDAYWDDDLVYVIRDQNRRMVGFVRLWHEPASPDAVILSLTIHEAYREGGLDRYLLSEVVRMTGFKNFYADVEGIKGDQSKHPKIRYAGQVGFKLISADDMLKTAYADLVNPEEATDPIYQAFLISSTEALGRFGAERIAVQKAVQKVLNNTALLARIGPKGWLQPTRESGIQKKSRLLNDEL